MLLWCQVGKILFPGKIGITLFDGHVDDIGDIFSFDFDCQASGAKTMPLAGIADLLRHILVDIFFIAEHIMGKFDHSGPLSFERMALPGKFHFPGCAVENRFFLMLFQLRIGDGDVDIVLDAKGIEKLCIVALVKAVEDFDRTLFNRELRIDDLFEVDGIAYPQSVTAGAGSLGGVEGEGDRLERFEADLAIETGEVFRVVDMRLFDPCLFAIENLELHFAIALLECLFDILADPVTALLLDDDTVHNHLDRMLFCFGEFDLLIQAHHYPVYHSTDIPFVAQRFEHIGKTPLLLFDQRRENDQLGAVGEFEHLFDDIAGTHRRDRLAALVAVLLADTGEEQTQIVVYLGDRPHRGTGIFGCGLLIDGDRGCQPFDLVYIRLAYLAQKLAGIAGE